MKIALAQMNCLVGDVEGNTKKMLKSIELAKKAGAKLVCFHELAVVGYPPRDLLELPALYYRVEKANEIIMKASKGIAVVFGTLVPNLTKVGKPLFNAALWCEEGEIKSTIKKNLLPTYDVFDETRYFKPGFPSTPIEFEGHQIGITICEDIWNDANFWPDKLYHIDPVADLSKLGMNFLINLSASPYSVGRFESRSELVTYLAKKYHLPVVYLNQVGGNDELIFDGGSFVVDEHGTCLGQASFFKEELLIVDTKSKKEAPCSKADELDMLEEALIMGVRDYVKKCGFKKVVLGLSGGIDSALVAYLASQALGPKNVHALVMPSRYSSKGSKTDAFALAKNLKINCKEISIDAHHKLYEKTFGSLFGKSKPGLAEENIQARIRGNLLMAFSNKKECLVLTTGNKSEMAAGYCTLYGDMAGALSVIGDVLKTKVYELCFHINRKKKVFPSDILTKAPSAELRPNQKDQDSLPPYEVLDDLIEMMVVQGRADTEMGELGYDKRLIEKVRKLLTLSEYKRRQSAPILRVSNRAFGIGRRYPVACKNK